MSNGPLFSIIIPSYNQGHFIEETINSVLSQSYKNTEVLVIDGGSSDGTIEVLKSFGDRIFWMSEKDRGQTHAINKGLTLSKGAIIAYLNSDDYYLDGTLEKVTKIFESDKDTLWLTGDYVIVNEKGVAIQSFIAIYKRLLRKRLSFNLLTVLNPVIQPSTFMTRSLMDRVGAFNEELRYTMDYDYWLRAISIQRPVILRDKLSAFRVHKESKGGSQYSRQFEEELKVAKVYQNHSFLTLLHGLHNLLIRFCYFIIK